MDTSECSAILQQISRSVDNLKATAFGRRDEIRRAIIAKGREFLDEMEKTLSFNFLDLPIELRAMIYEAYHAVEGHSLVYELDQPLDSKDHESRPKSRVWRQAPPLALICKQVHAEFGQLLKRKDDAPYHLTIAAPQKLKFALYPFQPPLKLLTDHARELTVSAQLTRKFEWYFCKSEEVNFDLEQLAPMLLYGTKKLETLAIEISSQEHIPWTQWAVLKQFWQNFEDKLVSRRELVKQGVQLNQMNLTGIAALKAVKIRVQDTYYVHRHLVVDGSGKPWWRKTMREDGTFFEPSKEEVEIAKKKDLELISLGYFKPRYVRRSDA